MKLTSDPTYERSVRYGLTGDGLDAYQSAPGRRVRALRAARGVTLSRAEHFVVPSASLRELAIGWGIEPAHITLLPNPVSVPTTLAPREELRRRHAFAGPTLAFAGRLVPQKSLEVGLEALVTVDGVELVIVGDGPEEQRLRQRSLELGLGERVRFLGAQPRGAVFELLHAADAALLTSSWENFPHMVVESLAVGTPVLATAVGGVTEIVRDGENGLLVPTGDSSALARAMQRYFADDELRARLRTGAPESVGAYAPDEIYARLIDIVERAARR
jgi:glycosyltransferase involved in cell wall biosynthesis